MKCFEYTGQISSGRYSGRDAYFVISNDNDEYRMFGIYGDIERAKELNEEFDIERHIRYDLGMNTDMVFTIHHYSQDIVFWRWKIMRQKSELVRYIVDQARIAEYKDGTQSAIVWVQNYLQPIVAFEITDEIMDEIHKELQQHPNIVTVERNGGWFTITARFDI